MKPNKLSKSALYRKLMQNVIILAQNILLKPITIFEISNLKLIIFGKKLTFYNITIKLKIFCNQNNIILKYFADIRFRMVLVQIIRQK